ncbi:IMPACT family member yigZ [Citrobacter koseri]|nr:IMPACT family member yigZ [Citrobacter koseri]
MLAQLMGSGVGEITAVVVRYYGGILLGTGGLVKAYGGGVNQALRQLTTQRKTPLTEYTLQCEYGQLAGIEALLGQFAGQIVTAIIRHSFGSGWRFLMRMWMNFQQGWRILAVVHCNC